MKESDIIFISFLNPFKEMADGGSQDVKRRIIALANQGYRVKVFAVEKKQYKKVVGLNNANITIEVYDRHIHFPSVFQLKPYPVLSRFNKKLIVDLENELKNPVRAIIVEGMQCMAIVNALPAKLFAAAPTILRIHNLEYNYYLEMGKSKPFGFFGLKKLVYFLTSVQYKAIETKFIKKFDYVHFISKMELTEFSSKQNNTKSMQWVPPIANKPLEISQTTNRIKEFNLVFFGDLTLPLNYQGVNWFINNVLQNLLTKFPYHLHVAGCGSNNIVKHDSVTVHGYVQELSVFLNKADLIVLPILNGAGVKIKTIDSLTIGLPVIGTSVAFDGLSKNITDQCNIQDQPQAIIDLIEDIRQKYSQYSKSAEVVQQKVLADFGPETYAEIINQIGHSVEFSH